MASGACRPTGCLGPKPAELESTFSDWNTLHHQERVFVRAGLDPHALRARICLAEIY